MPELKAGDIFCTGNPMMLGRAIRAVEAFWDPDGKAEYSHAGIILGPNATTFEALWSNKRQGLFAAYADEQIIIGRHERMTTENFLAGWAKVSRLEGRPYAGHRLFLNLIPPLARIISTGGFAVCSEIVAKFLSGAGLLGQLIKAKREKEPELTFSEAMTAVQLEHPDLAREYADSVGAPKQ